jgi:hypothetical protein
MGHGTAFRARRRHSQGIGKHKWLQASGGWQPFLLLSCRSCKFMGMQCMGLMHACMNHVHSWMLNRCSFMHRSAAVVGSVATCATRMAVLVVTRAPPREVAQAGRIVVKAADLGTRGCEPCRIVQRVLLGHTLLHLQPHPQLKSQSQVTLRSCIARSRLRHMIHCYPAGLESFMMHCHTATCRSNASRSNACVGASQAGGFSKPKAQ